MVIIGFFRDLFSQMGSLMSFVTTPLGDMYEVITVEPIKSMSIISLLGIGLVSTLGICLAFRVVRLFIGG